MHNPYLGLLENKNTPINDIQGFFLSRKVLEFQSSISRTGKSWKRFECLGNAENLLTQVIKFT